MAKDEVDTAYHCPVCRMVSGHLQLVLTHLNVRHKIWFPFSQVTRINGQSDLEVEVTLQLVGAREVRHKYPELEKP